jgi:hypothetical protein
VTQMHFLGTEEGYVEGSNDYRLRVVKASKAQDGSWRVKFQHLRLPTRLHHPGRILRRAFEWAIAVLRRLGLPTFCLSVRTAKVFGSSERGTMRPERRLLRGKALPSQQPRGQGLPAIKRRPPPQYCCPE